MSTPLDSFKQDKLMIDVVQDGARQVQVVWKGVADSQEPAKNLGPFLNRLAESLSAHSVTVDFRRFEYMNSATVAPIIQFIKELDHWAEKAVLRYDQEVHWQRVNFNCVKTIAQMLRRVEVLGS